MVTLQSTGMRQQHKESSALSVSILVMDKENDEAMPLVSDLCCVSALKPRLVDLPPCACPFS